jgi:hypothetical protein
VVGSNLCRPLDPGRTTKCLFCRAPARRCMAKTSLPCADVRQTISRQYYKIHKNYQINLKNFRKLTQIKLCCLLLIETSFEVKTQFEWHVYRNYMKQVTIDI